MHPIFSLEQNEHDNMVSQTISGCQQRKLQSQGTFQAKCVSLINITISEKLNSATKLPRF